MDNTIELELRDFLFAGGILLLFAAGAFAVRFLAFPFFIRLSQKLSRPNIELIQRSFQKPIFFLILLLGVYFCLTLLPFELLKSGAIPELLKKLCTVGSILLLTWGFFSSCQVVPRFIHGFGMKFDFGTGKALVNFITRLCQAVVVLISATMVLGAIGYDINGVLAGLGLGGLTFALAGQDLAGNFFGGLVIVAEQPMEIGDWISTPDVEGSVEDITLRSTKIRTLDGALTIVPNSKLTSTPITNWTRMNMRLCQFKLGLLYSTPKEVLTVVMEDIRTLLKENPAVNEDTVQVRLLDFAPSSIDITVIYYTKCTAIKDYRAAKEEINLQIMGILEQRGAQLAYPSQSIYFSTPLKNN